MKIFRNLLLLMLVSLFVVSITGCNKKNVDNSSSKEEAQDITSQNIISNTKIKIAYIAMPNMAPQVLINEKEKIFETILAEKGYTVEWVITRSLDNIWPMMDQDEVDFVYIPTQNFVTYVTETSDFGGSDKYRMIAGSLDHNSNLLMAGPKIKSLKDLDQKTVGVPNKFYVEEMLLNKQLESVGLSTKSMGGSVEVEYIDWMNKLWENFSSGKYAAISAWTSQQVAIEKRVPGSKLLMNLNEGSEFGPSVPKNSLVVKKAYIDSKPEIVKLILKAHIKATEMALEKNSDLPLLAKSAYEDYFDKVLKAVDYPKYTKEFMIKDWSGSQPTYDPNLTFIKEAYDFTVKAGYMKDKQIDNLIDTKPINEVLVELNKSPIK